MVWRSIVRFQSRMMILDQARSEPVAVNRQNDVTQVVTHYSSVAVVLHWLIAVLLILNIALAWSRSLITREQAGAVMAFHISTGILVLLLSLVRLAWRIAHPAPPYPAGLPARERVLAHATQWGFYFIMIAMPLTGWIMTSGPRAHEPLSLYGLVPWPLLSFVHQAQGQAGAIWHKVGEAHGLLAWLAYLLIILHVGGALKHQFIDRDVIMARMSPFARKVRR